VNDRFFHALRLVRLNRDEDLVRELDAAQRAGWTGIAIKMTMADPRIHPEQADYWTAFGRLLEMCHARGLSTDCILFGGDVKRVMPDPDDRRRFVERVHTFLQGRSDVDIVLMDMTPQGHPPPSIDPFYDEDGIATAAHRVGRIVIAVVVAMLLLVAWWYF
jgi:hypothetical protein